MSYNDELFHQIIQKLVKQAESDEIITEEEAQMINRIKLDVKTYLQAVNEANEDGIVTEEEKEKLIDFQKEILIGAWDQSEKDKVISADEYAIIEKLFHVLSNIDI